MDIPDLPEACQNLVRDLSAYLDGETSPERSAEIEQHLATCSNCHAVTDTMRKTLRLYQELPRPELPPDVRRRLYHTLDLIEPLPPAQ